jgi:hypothetical protein
MLASGCGVLESWGKITSVFQKAEAECGLIVYTEQKAPKKIIKLSKEDGAC